MPRPRRASPANYNVQTNLNITHLAFAATKYYKEGKLNAIKSTSTLIRTIVEDWIELQGGHKLSSLDHAKEILAKLGLPIERKERIKDRGFSGNIYEDEEQMDSREEWESNQIKLPEDKLNKNEILAKAREAEMYLATATDRALEKPKNNSMEEMLKRINEQSTKRIERGDVQVKYTAPK